MGSCFSVFKKKVVSSSDGDLAQQQFDNLAIVTETSPPEISFGVLTIRNTADSNDEHSVAVTEILTAQRIHGFVMDVLHFNEHSDITSWAILQGLAESEEIGWMIVVMGVAISIPMDHPSGPSCISMILRSIPLPTKESTTELTTQLMTLTSNADESDNEKSRRNSCIVIGCLADILGGQCNILLTSEVMEFLFFQLNKAVRPCIILHSLNTLEKLAQNAENKTKIFQTLETTGSDNPLLKLEKWIKSDNLEKRQVGFFAHWLLDNMFLVQGRRFGYELVNNSTVAATLNCNDVTPYLKLSPNGLEARCDSSTFESVRCTYQIDSGAWYYEVLLVTEGLMQIGWATKRAAYLNITEVGYGIGDDDYSVGFDGYRKYLWHANETEPLTMSNWKPGDIVGAFIDLDALEIIFYLNGEVIATHKDVFNHATSGFFAAASYGIFQQCEFNFGSRPFAFAPYGKLFKTFNFEANLESGNKSHVVLPRHLRMKEYLRNESVQENVCKICVDNISNIKFFPCEHSNVCSVCSDQLDICPFCREIITEKVEIYGS